MEHSRSDLVKVPALANQGLFCVVAAFLDNGIEFKFVVTFWDDVGWDQVNCQL